MWPHAAGADWCEPACPPSLLNQICNPGRAEEEPNAPIAGTHDKTQRVFLLPLLLLPLSLPP